MECLEDIKAHNTIDYYNASTQVTDANSQLSPAEIQRFIDSKAEYIRQKTLEIESLTDEVNALRLKITGEENKKPLEEKYDGKLFTMLFLKLPTSNFYAPILKVDFESGIASIRKSDDKEEFLPCEFDEICTNMDIDKYRVLMDSFFESKSQEYFSLFLGEERSGKSYILRVAAQRFYIKLLAFINDYKGDIGNLSLTIFSLNNQLNVSTLQLTPTNNKQKLREFFDLHTSPPEMHLLKHRITSQYKLLFIELSLQAVPSPPSAVSGLLPLSSISPQSKRVLTFCGVCSSSPPPVGGEHLGPSSIAALVVQQLKGLSIKHHFEWPLNVLAGRLDSMDRLVCACFEPVVSRVKGGRETMRCFAVDEETWRDFGDG